MSTLEYEYLVKELESKIIGKYFSRIRKVEEGGYYRMKIGDTEIAVQPGIRMHVTKYIEKNGDMDQFGEKVEKELENARLNSIELVNNDRIIQFKFNKGELIFEMFGHGNVILVRDGKTVCAMKYEKWSDREITAKVEYKLPKSGTVQKLELNDKYVIVSLMKLPLGKSYAMVALERTGIDEKKQGNTLNTQQKESLETEIGKIIKEAAPRLFFEAEKPVEFGLCQLTRYPKCTITDTLSEAADEYYQKVEIPNPQLDKLEKRLETQQQRRIELIEEEKENKAKGDIIYGNYASVEELITLAKTGKFEALEKKGIKIDKKEKTIEIEI